MQSSPSLALKIFQALDLVGDPGIRDPADPPQRNAPSPLATFLAFVLGRLRRGVSKSADHAAAGEFRQQVNATLLALEEWVAEVRWRELDGNASEWQSSGIHLDEGECVTVLAQGRLYLSRVLDVSVGPSAGLWYRINGGQIARLPGPGGVLRAQSSGELLLMPRLPGGFSDPQGSMSEEIPSPRVQGQFQAAVIRWRGDPRNGLTRANALAPTVFGPALDSLGREDAPPAGWRHLWRLGNTGIYREHPSDGSLCCHAKADGGILQHAVDVPLTAGLRLHWSWLTEQLPSSLAEHIQPTHDYLSLAVEFDNGLDLTYMWSSQLPIDTIFQCPLPWWDQRETHWVIRNDPAQLGLWLDERRNLLTDYKRAIGGELPRRVVGIWLIANSLFQRGEGRCRYRDIRLADKGDKTIIHP